MDKSKKKVVTWLGVFLITLVATAAITALMFELLWNFVAPSVFGLPEISFYQALALYIMVRLIIIQPDGDD